MVDKYDENSIFTKSLFKKEHQYYFSEFIKKDSKKIDKEIEKLKEHNKILQKKIQKLEKDEIKIKDET